MTTVKTYNPTNVTTENKPRLVVMVSGQSLAVNGNKVAGLQLQHKRTWFNVKNIVVSKDGRTLNVYLYDVATCVKMPVNSQIMAKMFAGEETKLQVAESTLTVSRTTAI